jgi:hypothetical protein
MTSAIWIPAHTKTQASNNKHTSNGKASNRRPLIKKEISHALF